MARAWTPEEEDDFRRMRESGLTLKQIAARLGRTHDGVMKKSQALRHGRWALPMKARAWIPSTAMILCRRNVAEAFGYRDEELTGRARKRDLVRARHAAMYVLRERFGMSAGCVGVVLGDRDHSTVLHGIAKTRWAMKRDDVFRVRVAALIAGRACVQNDAHVVAWRAERFFRGQQEKRIANPERDDETGELLESEKVWCGQCDARVTIVRASRCGSRFCSFRRAA